MLNINVAYLFFYLKLLIRRLIEIPIGLLFICFDFCVTNRKVLDKPRDVAIVFFGAIGDYVLFRNFLPFYKTYAGKTGQNLVLIGNQTWIELAKEVDQDSVDRFIAINCAKLRSSLPYRQRVLAAIDEYFTQIIQPGYSREFRLEDCFIRSLRATKKIGVKSSNNNSSRLLLSLGNMFFDRLVDTRTTTLFEFDRNLEIAKNITEEEFEVRFSAPDLNGYGVPEDVQNSIVLFPGASRDYRRYPSTSFAYLVLQSGVSKQTSIVVLGGKEDGASGDQIIQNLNGYRVKNLTGKTNLLETWRIISCAKLVISNETVAAHMSAASDVSTICLSNGNHFGRFNPYPVRLNHIVHFYPKSLDLKKYSFDFLSKRFKHRSVLDIKTIDRKDVIERINAII